MALTETSTAYASTIKNVLTSEFCHSFTYTVRGVASASANATIVLGPKVQNGLWVTRIEGAISSGSASCPVDIGIQGAISTFASQKTQGVNLISSDCKSQVFPFKVSVSDDAAALYQTVAFGITPSSNTTGIVLKYNVFIARDIE